MYFGDLYNLFIRQPTGLLLVLVTGFVGGVALYIYRKQHKDEKDLAAQTIYSEISTAENRLKDIRKRFFETDQPSVESNVVMPYESWSKYKYLFLKDLSEEEWNMVDSFYSNCSNYDEAVRLNQRPVDQLIKENYKHLYMHYAQVIDDYHKDNPTKSQLPKKELDQLLTYQRLYLNEKNKAPFDYLPRQAVNAARTALVQLDTSVSSSSSGQKIKHIAKF